MRNEAKYEAVEFDVENLFNKILRSVASRKRVEERMTQTRKILLINNLFNAIVLVKNVFDFSNAPVR